VYFANERFAGDLGANVILDPLTATTYAGALGQMIAHLHHGGVGFHVGSAVAFLASRDFRGACAGHDRPKIESGAGFVHNPLMLEGSQKNLVRAPCARSWPLRVSIPAQRGEVGSTRPASLVLM
jgi:aldehyde dehydrogenase (NAD(P)+)